MNDKLTAIKAAMTAAITALGAFLGWKGIMAIIWVVCMALDYLSGTAAACKSGEWSSYKAREGVWHKGGMILVVLVSGLADIIMATICENLHLGFVWPGLVLPMVLAWYIITEIGSILENAISLGAKVPSWLVKLMKAGLKAVDAAGEKVLPDISSAKDNKEVGKG